MGGFYKEKAVNLIVSIGFALGHAVMAVLYAIEMWKHLT